MTFDTKEYGTAPAPQTVEKGQKAVKPDIPKASGVTFEGWYSNPACTGDAFDFDTPITSDITLYAKWTKDTYTITYSDGTTTTYTVKNGAKGDKGVGY